jgi:predicted DNA-binding transcriptional regulator YafY
MKADLQRMCRFVDLLHDNPRIRVATLQRQTGIPLFTLYRWIRVASCVMPIRLENGVIIHDLTSTSLSRHDNPSG